MRVLVADDDQMVLQAYRTCLSASKARRDDALAAMGDELFGSSAARTTPSCRWEGVDFVSQGEDAVERVREACASGLPYGVLFLDMMMPPGIDGLETARRIRVLDPEINIVVVTGYTDHSPEDICDVAGPDDKIFYLAKPFEIAEIRTLANSLLAKWSLERELREARAMLSEKVRELQASNIELAASEARCRHIAMHDQLTHLPNRTAFQQELDALLSDDEGHIAVMFLDLDRFKHVNDTLGHAAGDDLICTVAKRLQQGLPPGSAIARLGGDEFGIALPDVGAADCLRIGQTLVELCRQPTRILGTLVQVGASVGIARRDRPNLRSFELLRRADLALYVAKSKGRNRAEEFQECFDESARKRSEVEARLRTALENSELKLAYQPIRDPSEIEPVGYEALLRWEDAYLGTISPSIFVPIAEETGLIVNLGEWVIDTAVAECATWPQGFVSINVSTRHLQSPNLIAFLEKAASEHGLAHDRIQLEITETALFDDAILAAQVLINLRNRGFRIALDDFGTGYSSLVNLKEFEIDCIKIDQSFIALMGSDATSTAIVQAVAGLARALGLKVVAEGVESEAQVQALRLTGCELMQGFFFGAAMPPDTIVHAAHSQLLKSA